MSRSQLSHRQLLWGDALFFGFLMWLLSRLVIGATMLVIAPSLSAPPGGIIPTADWSVFSYSDSPRYETIATGGYEYGSDAQEKYNIVFFPLFPLLTRAVMMLGLPFDAAGTLVNNLAFLGALVVLYRWVEEHHGKSVARWATGVLAWCPMSLFGSVVYTEGLFLLFSTAALRAFEQQHYTWATLWGAIATTSRVTAVALIPTFLIVAWRERRPVQAYITTVFGGAYLLWHLRSQLELIVLTYSFSSLGLIMASGGAASAQRYAYGIVSLSIALGVLLERYPRWGYATMVFFAIALVNFALRFSQHIWVA